MPPRKRIEGAGAKGASGTRGTTGATGQTPSPSPPPVAHGRNVAGETEKVIPRWDDPAFKGHRSEMTTLKELADEVVEMTRRRKILDDGIKERTIVMRAQMSTVNDEESWSVADDSWTASYVKPAPRKTIVPERLIEQGVSWKQIDKATKLSPVTPFVTVRERSAGKTGGSNGEED